VAVTAITADRVKGRGRAVLASVAGPLSIVAAVLALLHDFAFRGLITFTQADVAAYWLPTYCHLGSSLASGHVPAWNPYSLAGAPFAADPQSGWMYLPVMALFSAFSCDVAMRMYIVLLPILGGLGSYWFLREEGTDRISATVGGLVLALGVAGSRMAVNLPFSGTLAWTPLLLAGTARYLKSRTWPGRLGWLTVTAAAWGQLAAAHLSHGFVIGSAAVVVYVAARSVSNVREGRLAAREAVGLAALLPAALLLVNLAFFLPRVAYLPRTTLGQGYAGLHDLADGLAGRSETPFGIGPAAGPRWPFVFTVSPGPYLGALPLGLSLAGWRVRSRRTVLIAFGLLGLGCYLLSLGLVARAVEPLARAVPFGDFYIYSPFRFRYAVLLVIPLLAGFGLDAWRRARGAPTRWTMLLPGVALWWILPFVLGVRPQRLWLLALGAAAGTAILIASGKRSRLLLAVPAVVAIELVAGGLIGQASSHEFFVTGLGPARSLRPLTPLLEPTIEAASSVRPGPVASAIRSNDGGRYLSLDPVRGYLGYQDPAGWPFLTDQRGMLFEIEEAQGYNPVQPFRYWAFIRAANPDPELHNVSVLRDPSPAVLDVLGIEWIITPTDRGPPEQTAEATVREGVWTLWRRGSPPSRASLMHWWRVVGNDEASLRAVIDPGFAFRAEAVLERGPGVPSRSNPFDVSRIGPQEGTRASFRWVGKQEAIVEVQSATGGILVVRNGYDPHWHAVVDGKPAPVLPADHFLQGIQVPGGRHTIVLAYDDPWIGYGLVGTGVVLGGVLAASAVLRRRRSRTTNHPTTPVREPQATPETARP
jgi:hypothetical protein